MKTKTQGRNEENMTERQLVERELSSLVEITLQMEDEINRLN